MKSSDNLRWFVLCMICTLLTWANLLHADNGVITYPTLGDPNAWTLSTGPDEKVVAPKGADGAAIYQAGEGFLGLRFVPGQNIRLTLKQPVALPAGVRDLVFYSTNSGIARVNLTIRHVIRDQTGAEYLYNIRSDLVLSNKEGQYSFDSAGHRSQETQHITPGLRYPDIQRNMHAPASKGKPQGKLTWVGMAIETTGVIPSKVMPSLFFRDFKSRTLSPRDSALQYQFANHECFVEVDGLPHISPGRYWWWAGKYELSWAVRDRFDGQPFLTGSYSLDAYEKNNQKPLAVQLAERVDIPIQSRGTYWVQVRIRRTDPGRRFQSYERVSLEDIRLDVIRGSAPETTHKPIDPHANHAVVIAPGRASLSYDVDESFTLPISFALPAPQDKTYTGRVIVYSWTTGEEVARWQEPITKSISGPTEIKIDLTKIGPGGYRVDAALIEMQNDGQPGPVYDMAQRIVAKRSNANTSVAEIPQSVPSAADRFKSDEPLFHLDASFSSTDRMTDPGKAWTNGFQPFLEEVGSVTKTVEYSIPWPLAEPVSGVYDWKDIDRFVDAAHAKGLTVLLRPSFTAYHTPDWVQTELIQDIDGHVFGHTAYLFHGMRPDYFYSPLLKNQLNRFLMAMVEHYRGNPGVHGYYLLLEHPGDSPWSGFFGGYETSTIEAFRATLRQQYVTVEAMNAALGTDWKDWNSVTPPQPRRLASSTVESPPMYRLAWLHYKDDAIADARKEFVLGVRKIDPKRLLLIYGTSDSASWFAQHGCMTANGGTHNAHMPGYLGTALDGLQMQNEEITPCRWSGTGVYQLDDTLFHASIAGGAHANCKAFIDTSRRFSQVQDSPYSLGKYIKFQPLWRELRGTQTMPIQTFALVDRDAAMYQYDSVGIGRNAGGWGTENLFSNHLTVALADPQQWSSGRLLLAISESGVEWLKQEVRDRVTQFVRNGGTLLMRADAGRRDFNKPANDWVLLRELGFPAPEAPQRAGYRSALTIKNANCTIPVDERFKLRDTWQAPDDAQSQVLAKFVEGGNSPALTCKRFGKGLVMVQWAESLIPPQRGGGYPILGALADWVGVDRPARSDNPRLWMNLLKNKPEKPDAWYCTVYAGPAENASEAALVAGRIWWPGITNEGIHDYTVTELISGENLGRFPAEQLRTKGFEIKLALQQVAFYRFTPVK